MRYYYGQLSRPLQGVYDALLGGFRALAPGIRIPMLEEIRSLNLSNSVAIVLYEALRQNGFAGMEKEGRLHRLEWK